MTMFLAALAVGIAAATELAPTPDGHPPALPVQYTATGGTAAAPYTVYSDAIKRVFGKYTGSTFNIVDCGQKLKYTNAGPLPIPGLPPGPCVTSALTSLSFECPGMYAPNWPPAAVDTYAGFRQKLNFQGKRKCPGNSSMCDHYVYDMYHDGYEVFDFFVDTDTQSLGSGTIKVGKVLYTHSFHEGVDASFLQRPTSCPDPTGQCAVCFTGPCGPCQKCLKAKTGPCAKCWAKDPKTGFSCLQEDGMSLCQTCYKPPAPKTQAVAADKCDICNAGACAACKPCANMKTGPCAPCWEKHSNGSACLPDCPNAGCWPAATVASTPPKTPAVVADKCDICNAGACAACKPCANVKTGPCAPCWAKHSNGSACLPDCPNAGCWPAATVASTPPKTPAVVADKCDICNAGACAACKPCANVKTGPCAPCWAKHSNGSACLPDCPNAGCWDTTFFV